MKFLFYFLFTAFFSAPASAGILAVLSQGSAKLWGGGSCSSADSTKTLAAAQSSRQCLLSSNDISAQGGRLQTVGDAANADAEDTFFSALALQHSKELDCSADFARQLAQGAPEARQNLADKLKVLREAKQRLNKASVELSQNLEATPKVCPLTLADLQPNPMILSIAGKDVGYELCKEIITTRAAYQAVYHSMPLAGMDSVKSLLEDYANETDPAKADAMTRNLDGLIAKAYGGATDSLKKSATDLRRKGEGSGAELDRSTRYALLSDPLVVSHVIDTAGPENREIMKGLACRADQRYGSGADALDRTVMIGSLVISGGSGVLLRAGTVAARVAAGANGVRAAGLLSINAARALEFSAMGLSAGLDGVAAYSQIDKSCGSQAPGTLAQGMNSSRQCVAAPTVQQLGQDSCVLAVSLSALGFTSALGPTLLKGGKLAAAEVKAATGAAKSLDPAVGAALNQEQRLSSAADILGRPLSVEQKEAVLSAHEVGAGQAGKDGTPAGVGNYTQAQLREKAVQLKAAGFSETEVRQLMESGIVGHPRLPASLDPALATDARQKSFREALVSGSLESLPDQQKILSIPFGDGRYAYKIIASKEDGHLLVEDLNGKQMWLAPDQLGGVRFASDTTATEFYRQQKAALQNSLAQTPAASDRVSDFRRSWSSGELSSRQGASSVISYRPDGGSTNLAAQVSKLYPDGRVEVRLYDGSTKILTKAELASAKFSSPETAQGFLQAASLIKADQAASESRVSSLFRQQRGLSVDPNDAYVSGRVYRSAQGESVPFQIRSSANFRDEALRDGRIQEFSQGQSAKLAPGSYAYLITRDGKLVTGKVEDTFELGVKHQNLANGREVVSAGELKVLPNGTYEYNLESGTFTRSLIESGSATRQDLAVKTDQALQDFFKTKGRDSGQEILLPQVSPSIQTIRQACSASEFLLYNAAACCKTVGLGCH